MYEIRKKKQQELRGKWWFLYILLILGIFLFSEGCILIRKSSGTAFATVLLGVILHSASVGGLYERIFKKSSSKIANMSMIIFLLIVAVICYFIKFGFVLIILIDLFSILIYVTVSLIFKNK